MIEPAQTADVRCPNCGLINPASAITCDCGFEFATGSFDLSATDAMPGAAGVPFWPRAGAHLVDAISFLFLVVMASVGSGVLTVIVATAMGRTVNLPSDGGGVSSWLLGYGSYALFFTLFNGLYGATPGHLLLRQRVVRLDGTTCGLGAALTRTVWLLFDGLFLGAIAYGKMKPPLFRRWGDMRAGTIVVRTNAPSAGPFRSAGWFLAALGLYVSIVLLADIAAVAMQVGRS